MPVAPSAPCVSPHRADGTLVQPAKELLDELAAQPPVIRRTALAERRRGWRRGQVCLSATRDLTVSHVDPAVCCHRFQHPAIMSDQEQRAGIGLKGGLQLLDRRQVKMVRRLVKH